LGYWFFVFDSNSGVSLVAGQNGREQWSADRLYQPTARDIPMAFIALQ
jgi:hypothetical protein